MCGSHLYHIFCVYHAQEYRKEDNIGTILKEAEYKFDVVHTSVMKRANKATDIILREIGQANVPRQQTWRLNECHWGDLTGMTKSDVAKHYGPEWVYLRQNYDFLN